MQDLGRVGYRASGVTVGGALDRHALWVANLLVGNDEMAAGLELSLGAVRFEFEDDRMIAWCGGSFRVQIGANEIPPGRAASGKRGETLRISPVAEGGRAWLAIAGGIDVPVVLGSRATDLRSGFGGLEGRALRDGDVLPLGLCAARQSLPSVADWGAPNEWSNTRTRHGFLRFVRGAQWDDFETDALTREAFAVLPESDRMGVRLRGPTLKRAQGDELFSEAVAPGTIQVPPGGDPILLLGDCQTVGGYPKIAHVISVDLAMAAQLMPGDTIRFVEVSLEEALELLRERARDFSRFQVGVALRRA